MSANTRMKLTGSIFAAEGLVQLDRPEVSPTGNKNYLDAKERIGTTPEGQPIYCRVHIYTPSPDTPQIRRRR
jgi:hypothetical protein